MIVAMIPAYNEEKTIGKVIERLPRKVGKQKVKVLVVDDGSHDDTVRVAKKAGADNVVSHPSNRGVGAAFKTGVKTALDMKADVMVNIDADLQFNPEDMPELVRPILDGKADMVTCSRFLDSSLEVEPKMPWIKKLGNRMFTSIVSWLCGKNFTDTQCGFRAYNREALTRLSLFGDYTYTQEAFLDLLNKGMRIKEVPCKVKGKREQGKSRVLKHWYTYGFRSLYIIMRTMRDQQPMKFFGALGGLSLLLGLVGFTELGSFLSGWFITNRVTLIQLSALLIIIGFILLLLGLIADMLDRQRKLLEEILYRQKNGG